MRAFCFRFLRRGSLVAISLGIIGYGLGQVFLIVDQFYSRAQTSNNDHVLWQTPMNMALGGLVVLFVLELIVECFSRLNKPKQPQKAVPILAELDDKMIIPPAILPNSTTPFAS